jgi:predicted RNase H-like HicB family nuclease
MLLSYIQAAMRKAAYKLLPEGGGIFGEIPDFDGLWASAPTLEACREELQSSLEDWILFGVADHLPIPSVDISWHCCHA